MNITLMAHDKKKELMVQFCTAYKSILAKHNLSATATTGRLVADATGSMMQYGFNPILCPPAVLYGVLGDLHIGWLRRAAGGWAAIGVLCVISVVIVIKHVHNIRRILHGTELRFSYMWMKDRDAEIARVQTNQARWDAQREEKARMAQSK